MNFILIAVLVLGAIALIAALVLFGVSKKFAVEEDPRLGQVGELLPGANCGGCGFAGCSGMAAVSALGILVPDYVVRYLMRNRLRNRFSFKLERC